MSKRNIEIIPVYGLPEFKKNDDLIEILTTTLKNNSETLLNGDVVIVTQKIISKIEDRAVDLILVGTNPTIPNTITTSILIIPSGVAFRGVANSKTKRTPPRTADIIEAIMITH